MQQERNCHATQNKRTVRQGRSYLCKVRATKKIKI
jgi:hypothetical protein